MDHPKGDLQLLKTNDHSDTLYSQTYEASYHSLHGAIQESNHVFIQQGLHQWIDQNPEKKQILIFELGFGTGLNAYLSYLDQKDKREITYFSVEKHPVELNLIEQLNYRDLIEDWNQNEFLRFHSSEWDTDVFFDSFSLHKIRGDISNIVIPEEIDLIYYDAFAPSSQPELWQESVLSKLSTKLITGGVLVTYCSQGAFRRSLTDLGMHVQKCPGPPGKREMVFAVKY